MTDDSEVVKPENLLSFFTGLDSEPPLGFVPRPRLLFTDALLASSNTCGYKLYLPLNNSTYELFKYRMVLSLMGHGGFGRV